MSGDIISPTSARRARKPREPIEVIRKKIVETALEVSRTCIGEVLFVAPVGDIQRTSGFTRSTFFRAGSPIDLLQNATGLDFLHEGVVLGKSSPTEDATKPVPAQDIETLALSLSREELGRTIGVLAALLAHKE